MQLYESMDKLEDIRQKKSVGVMLIGVGAICSFCIFIFSQEAFFMVLGLILMGVGGFFVSKYQKIYKIISL